MDDLSAARLKLRVVRRLLDQGVVEPKVNLPILSVHFKSLFFISHAKSFSFSFSLPKEIRKMK